MALVFDPRLNIPRRSGITLRVTNNGDGTATATWTAGYTHPNLDHFDLEVSTDQISWGGASLNISPEITTENVVMNDSTPYYWRLIARDSLDAEIEVVATFGPISITGDTDGAAYNARLVSASYTPSGTEAAANDYWASQLRLAGLSSSTGKIELGLLGWGVQAANLLKFFSGSCTETGTNTHNVAGKVTTGASGALLTGLVPSTAGFGGMGFYKLNTSGGAGIDMSALSSAGGLKAVATIPNYAGTYYACYAGPQTTEQVTGTGETAAGLYLAARDGATTHRFSRSTSGGTTTINNSALSGSGGLPTVQAALGCYNLDSGYSLFEQGQYACWVYHKTRLTTTERDDLIDILIGWLLDLGWIT